MRALTAHTAHASVSRLDAYNVRQRQTRALAQHRAPSLPRPCRAIAIFSAPRARTRRARHVANAHTRCAFSTPIGGARRARQRELWATPQPSVGWTWPQKRGRAPTGHPQRARCCRPREGLPRRHPNGGTRRARSHPAPGSTHEGREKKRRHTFPGTENLYRPAGGVTPRTAPGFSVAYHTQTVLMWPRSAARLVAALMSYGIGSAAYLPLVAHKRSPRLAFTRRRRGARDGKVCIHRLCLVIQTRFIRKEGGERLR